MLKQFYCKGSRFSTERGARPEHARADARRGAASQWTFEAAHDRPLGATIAEHVAAADALKRVRRRVDRG